MNSHKCALLNCRSLVQKIPLLHNFLSYLQPELVFLTESWLNSQISNSEISREFPYYVLRQDRNERKGGGVCALVSQFLLFEKITISGIDLSADVLCFDLYPPHIVKSRYILVYRPPNSSFSQDMNLIQVLADLSSSPCSNITILGDFNLDICWISQTARSNTAQQFLNLFESLSLFQFVNFPTRLDKTLDIILSYHGTISNVENYPPLGNSDHNTIIFSTSLVPTDTYTPTSYDFDSADKRAICNELSSLNWLAIFDNYLNIDDVYERFCQVIHAIIEHFVPKRTRKPTSFIQYPPHIMRLFEHRAQLCRIISHPTSSTTFTNLSKTLNYHIKRFLQYRTRKLASSKHKRKLFSYIKTCTKKN